MSTQSRRVARHTPIGSDMLQRMSQQNRTAQVALRMTPEDREELKRRAAESGRSIQEYALLQLIGRDVRYKPGPPRTARTDQELPMTG